MIETKFISEARLAWKLLNGVCVIFKPINVKLSQIKFTLLNNLSRDLNKMKVRPPNTYVTIDGDTNKEMKVISHPNYADHPLVVGPRYQNEDFKFSFINSLDTHSSGVLLCAFNSGTRISHKLQQSKATKLYVVKGILGQATNNYYITGKIVEKSTYTRAKREIIDKICASMQSSHQKKMFEMCGVDMQSQAAYELATKGLIRPADKNIPILYSIRCINFSSPKFTLEIVCTNEYEMYLKTLVHDIGRELHSTATCTQIQCVRYGVFDINLALLTKHWDLENILNNMKQCENILIENPFLLKRESPTLIEVNNK